MSKRSSLSGRLSRLKRERPASGLQGKPKEYKRETQKENKVFNLPGWDRIAPDVWRRSILKENILKGQYRNSLLIPDGTDSENLIFYDTETTGLSTGAGTIPFLIGLGRVSGSEFEIIQYFLADYPGEPYLLKALKEDFSDKQYFISYNGKSYDSHLIKTRFLLNGIGYKQGIEVDLLYLSRRLWKTSLENCRLGTIEKDILGINRGPDIPGSEIPDVWFDFLKTGNTNKLELVFSHNVQDIYSLASLLETINFICNEIPDKFNYDRFSLAKTLLFYGRTEGIELLNSEFLAGHRQAGQFLSLYYKREKQWERAVGIWKAMNKNGHNSFASVELAKYYEHRIKDPREALRIINRLLKSPLITEGELKDNLIHRKERLKGKIS